MTTRFSRWILIAAFAAAFGMGACVSITDFEGNNYQCDTDSDCPEGGWCHLKRLATDGTERSNFCVPTGQHWCRGALCPTGTRCSDTGDAGTCIGCPAPCSPWRE